MIELVKSAVVFNEENHTYFLGDKLALCMNTATFFGSPLQYKLRNIFIFIREQLPTYHSCYSLQQFVDSTGFTPESIEAENYLKERTNVGYKAFANEYTVSDNEHFASNIDCVWEKDERISLGDIKTTANLDLEYLGWQLSIYAYLFELQNPQ